MGLMGTRPLFYALEAASTLTKSVRINIHETLKEIASVLENSQMGSLSF